jgi:hypothetical protein
MLVNVLAAAALTLTPVAPVGHDSLSAAARLQPEAVSAAAVYPESAPSAALAVPALPVRSAASPGGPDAGPPQIIAYSDAYYTRLKIHKWASYLTLPLFAGEWYVGNRLMKPNAPRWTRGVHRGLAMGVGALFIVNTITGGMNLWEGRHDPYGRTSRLLHGALMLLSDAGFVATGITAYKLHGRYAFLGHDKRKLHKNVAIASMLTATIGYAIMLPPFHHD